MYITQSEGLSTNPYGTPVAMTFYFCILLLLTFVSYPRANFGSNLPLFLESDGYLQFGLPVRWELINSFTKIHVDFVKDTDPINSPSLLLKTFNQVTQICSFFKKSFSDSPLLIGNFLNEQKWCKRVARLCMLLYYIYCVLHELHRNKEFHGTLNLNLSTFSQNGFQNVFHCQS